MTKSIKEKLENFILSAEWGLPAVDTEYGRGVNKGRAVLLKELKDFLKRLEKQ